MAIITLNNENFKQEVLNSNKPVIVDFWASWCGPCRMMSPIIEEASNENPNIVFGKVNVDEERELAQLYGILSIPTLISFKNGKAYNKSVGVISKNSILNLIQ